MNHLVFGSRELKAIEVTLFHMCTSIYKIFLACLLCRFFFFFLMLLKLNNVVCSHC